jgi:predicted Zn-dependent peptidase
MTIDNPTTLAVTHHGVTASFTTTDTDIETMFVLFKAALLAMTFQQETIDDEILRMAEEIKMDSKPLTKIFK